MNDLVSVTDNDWFAFFSQQPGIDEKKRSGLDFSQSRLFWNAAMPWRRP
jgi:hypothetical protein